MWSVCMHEYALRQRPHTKSRVVVRIILGSASSAFQKHACLEMRRVRELVKGSEPSDDMSAREHLEVSGKRLRVARDIPGGDGKEGEAGWVETEQSGRIIPTM